MFRRVHLVILVGFALIVANSSSAAEVSVKLTAIDLGLTNDSNVKINGGSKVDPDNPNGLPAGSFFTSSTTGEGSVLNIELDGTAGPGVPLTNPLLVTVTANTRINNFPDTNDYQAGILFLSKKEGHDDSKADDDDDDHNGSEPDEKDEGLGVRAFTVKGGEANPADNGLRVIDPASGLAKIEGSKEVSGGIDTKHPDIANSPNGPDHVDEIALFDFNSAEVRLLADMFTVRLTKFKPGDDFLDLHLALDGGGSLDLLGLSAADAALFTDQGGDVWDLAFGGINAFLSSSALDPSDVLAAFSIRSVARPNGEKSHFLINGFTGEGTVVPEPSTIVLALVSLALCACFRMRRQWRNRC